MANETKPPSDDLKTRLASVLPKDKDFHIYHLSTPPTKCDPLYSPPPSQRPDRTYCEKHFLTVAINHSSTAKNDKQVLVLGLEIFIFTTSHSTTIFVSKADSTGYLHHLNLPSSTPSPIRQICATFVDFLVKKCRRKGIQMIVSLFARAQSQYLFPGSVDNKGKHVLDDRGLVKWWCRVLDPMVQNKSNGYLVVPGLDAYETRAFIPRGSTGWIQGHPLERISRYTFRQSDSAPPPPPRCLIPNFPDDPKSRFRDELDDEVMGTGPFRTTGSWKSVKTLDMFWEMMAFRQECSSGRLTGFIWVVFDDEQDESVPPPAPASTLDTFKADNTEETKDAASNNEKNDDNDKKTAKTTRLTPKRRKHKWSHKFTKPPRRHGPIPLRPPRVKSTTHRNNLTLSPAKSTAYYTWDLSARGSRVVTDKDYKRIVELLLHLDFSTLSKAVGSTRRWVGEVGLGGGGAAGAGSWGNVLVRGLMEHPSEKKDEEGKENDGDSGGAVAVNNLTSLVKRKRKDSAATQQGVEVKVLSQGLVRKKPKA